jgi:hypothetical protein
MNLQNSLIQIWKKKLTPGRQLRNSGRLAPDKLRPQPLPVQQPAPLTHRPLGSWNMQHYRCHMQFSTTKMMHHVHPRCGLVRDKPDVGKDKEEWTPKRQTGSTGICGSLFLLHHWCVMILPPENLPGQRREEYERRRAVEEGQLVNYNQAANRQDRAAARNACDPDQDKIMQDPGPANLEAMLAPISISDNNWVVLETPPWSGYYAEKYNAETETEPVHCPMGQDLDNLLANRERDR